MMRRALLVIVIALGAYEGVALWTPAEGDTISEVVWALSGEWPILTFLAGVTAGHLFWPRRAGGTEG